MPALPQPSLRNSIIATCLVLGLTLALELHLPAPINTDLFYVAVVAAALWGPNRRLVLTAAMLTSLLVLTGWLLVEHQGDPYVQAINRLLALTAIGLCTLIGLQIKDRNNRLRMLSQALEQSPVGIMLTDRQGRIEYVNPNFSQFTGYTSEELAGHSPNILKGVDTPERVYRDLWNTILAGRPWRGRLHNRRKDGSTYWESISISPVLDPRGEVVNFIAIMQDITVQLQRQRQQAQLQNLEVAGRLTSGIAHDFNNLLTIIIGNLQFLAGELGSDPRPELDEVLDDALSAAEDGAQLCNRLLAFSRHHEATPRIIDINHRLRNICQILTRILGDSYPIVVDTLPRPTPVQVDQVLLDSALINLAVNARDAMPQGGEIRISTHLPAGDENPAGHLLAITVSDEGRGIPPSVLERVTEPFFTTKADGRGTGLGLSMVKTFVEEAGGSIRIESKPGQGTRISLLLPTASGAMSAEDREIPSLPRGNETILLVEDNAMVRRSATRTLRELGYHVLVAENADAALQEARETTRSIDLLFTDVRLGCGMDGEMLAERLGEGIPGLAVLLTTGLREYLLPHHYPLLHKPYTRHQLGRQIRALLDH